ncbi:MAG TPA: histidine phosphatase family protein [Nevskiaceae bacterium]|nr:histidine phosphatase family protein [Nevskiaceae bacterium]
MTHRRLLSAALLLGLAAPLSAQTVWLVRHAEKAADGSADPGLSAAGQRRAQALAEALAGAGMARVISSDRRRTRDTALPLALQRGLAVQPTAAPAAVLAAELTAAAAASPVLVVGHSNTVPALLQALGVPPPAEWPDACYDRLYWVDLATTPPRWALLRYGEPSPGC